MIKEKIEVIVSKASSYIRSSRTKSFELHIFDTIRDVRKDYPEIMHGFMKNGRAYVSLKTGEEIPGSEYLSSRGIELKLH